jgi:hypothetical protein
MGTIRKDFEDLLYNGAKGDWYFINNDEYIVLQYGNTVDDVVVLPIAGANKWDWNGSHEAPTLSPSILVDFGSGTWHGFLREGVLINA